jgi:hypothetical protein
MSAQHWPVAFSSGAMTWQQPPATVEELIGRADRLMYSAKSRGRNALAFDAETGQGANATSSHRRASSPPLSDQAG